MTPHDWRLLEYSKAHFVKQTRHTYHLFQDNTTFIATTSIFLFEIFFGNVILDQSVLYLYSPYQFYTNEKPSFFYVLFSKSEHTSDVPLIKIKRKCKPCVALSADIPVSRYHESSNKSRNSIYQARNLRSLRQISVLIRKRNTKNSFFLSLV